MTTYYSEVTPQPDAWERTVSHAQLVKENELLRAALSDLYDEQNDAQLEKRRKQWLAAMKKASKALGYEK